MNLIGDGKANEALSPSTVEDIVTKAVEALQPDGQRVLVVIPDHTRTCPLGWITRALHNRLHGRAAKLDFLVALGTHAPESVEGLERLLEVATGTLDQVYAGSEFFNHEWSNPAELREVGSISADRVAEVTEGRFRMDVAVTINRRVFEYDRVVICGPVFPHEVVGFSGGAKYFFPGICGPELLNFFHWLGAVITCPKIIGTKHTPVRELLHVALDMLPIHASALCMVVTGKNLAGLYYGSVKDSWSAAADLSDQLHVTYVDKPFASVLSCAPPMYDELWTGAKCMYKLEPVVADGGELIIFAPAIEKIHDTHGPIMEEIGYHTRDYFVAQWDRFQDYPWGVVAHSTHVKGIGTYENGVEKPRIRVTLATGIPEEVCRKINLGYRDPASIDPTDWQDKEDQGRLYIPKAGETLYKLKNPPAWQRFD